MNHLVPESCVHNTDVELLPTRGCPDKDDPKSTEVWSEASMAYFTLLLNVHALHYTLHTKCMTEFILLLIKHAVRR